MNWLSNVSQFGALWFFPDNCSRLPHARCHPKRADEVARASGQVVKARGAILVMWWFAVSIIIISLEKVGVKREEEMRSLQLQVNLDPDCKIE